MKLRLRSLETKETTKIEVPTPCSLQHLKEVISQRVSSSSPDSVHLSLNRKDELLGSSPHDSLQSLGIITGDLIFFTFNPNAFIVSSETLIVESGSNSHDPKSIHTQNSRETLTLETNSEKKQTLNRNLVLNTQKEETLIAQSNRNSEEPKTMGTRISRETLTLESYSQKEKALDQTSKASRKHLITQELRVLIQVLSQTTARLWHIVLAPGKLSYRHCEHRRQTIFVIHFGQQCSQVQEGTTYRHVDYIPGQFIRLKALLILAKL